MTTIFKFDKNINFIVYLEPFENEKNFKISSSSVELRGSARQNPLIFNYFCLYYL